MVHAEKYVFTWLLVYVMWCNPQAKMNNIFF